MSAIRDIAEKFFTACESGQGWEACRQFCQEDAAFQCQAEALAEVKTLEAYTEWMRGLFGPLPDASYELTAFAEDAERKTVVASAVFRATHTGDGGPVDPTGKAIESDYAYIMEFDGDRIRAMTKIWNDGYALKRLGWA